MKIAANLILGRFRLQKLKTKLILFIIILVLFQVALIGIVSVNIISDITEEQIGKRALKVSQTVSLIPEIRENLISEDPKQRIQQIAEEIRKSTGAQFIVVGDHEGKRYSHPIKERLGKFMVGGDNRPALEEGKSYISKAVGTLGPSIRGKVPVFDSQGKVIGIVSVGYLLEDINTITSQYQYRVLLFLPFLILIGVLAAVMIANRVKEAILGLEPREIAALLQERTATLETVKEGVIAIDARGLITTINKTAFETIGLNPDKQALGRPILEIVPQTEMMEILKTGESHYDRELVIDDKEIIVNRIPIINEGAINGVVASFRRKDELDYLAKKLTQVEKYSELLRIQTHEYSNKLYTISGLVQIGHYQKAIDLISSETSGYQYLINFLMEVVPDPNLAGVILGKYSQAKELNVTLKIDPDSSMTDIPWHISREGIVTIVGNMLDNAFEAVKNLKESKRLVNLSMTDLGNDLIFEFDDAGPGIDQNDYEKIFEMGFSTKIGEGYGTGLYLVDRALKKLEGSISITSSDLGGAAFTVIIPKNERS
ncbi:MAG: sensor histidine kinase [Deltaproteobacteria bacterium]|jgi:two-component system, CitB family, sensor kinase|nr:sensor histidine kinase [Deltaproteobacteria bacterium]MBT4087775.1 sensor histidine kinase [Deltaproteobacteria bacterium]MBT4268282.1 sensor histidine kinase [Deltaproteobacteria bacterium]MBT4641400.1 sensor histidine kinase [Deltaproteobacteria bacterium]MBT6504092.1 sensor histidine kinase [Deltaproteobacteria bacterium]